MRLTLSLLLLSVAAATASAETATVNAASANVRAGAGTRHPVVGTLPRGTSVEVLETSDVWVRVRAAGGVEGWVSARLLQREAVRPADTRPAPAPDPDPARVSIEHREVSCLVAEEFVRLEACASPAAKVARTQVHFRAADTSPWYSVDMKPEGSCLSAMLPKPKSSTKEVHYFIYALDREFAETARPDGAPGTAFRPRVVASKADCGTNSILGSVGGGMRQVVVSIARSPAGKIIEGGASVLGSPAQVAGFSADGIVAAQPPASGQSASSTAGQGAAAAGAGAGAAAASGFPVVVVAGGVGAAAVVGGVVVAGGGDSPEEVSLTGTWRGTAASGKGLSFSFAVEGVTCSVRYDIDLTLTQTGTAVAGPATYVLREFRCNLGEIDPILASVLGQSGTVPLKGSLAPPSGITLDLTEGIILTGNYTATTIDVTGRTDVEGTIYNWTLSLVKS